MWRTEVPHSGVHWPPRHRSRRRWCHDVVWASGQLSDKTDHRRGAVSHWRSERCSGARRDREYGDDSRTIPGHRECRRRVVRSEAHASRPHIPMDTRCWLAASDRTVSAPVLAANLKYNSERDFVPIGFTAQSPRSSSRARISG